MKIYLIGQKGIPANGGGVERHVEELSERLAAAGHEVYVYTRPNYADPDLEECRGVRLLSLPSINSKRLDAISHTFRAIMDLRKREADIIHFHSIGPSSLIWLARLMKPGVPIMATFHSRCYFHKKWGLAARAYLRFGEWAACRLADKTISVSASLKQYADKKYGVETSLIPNGISEADMREADEIRKWGLEKGNYILSVSRLVRHKGVHHLIEAYNSIETDKKLVIAGDGYFTNDYVAELRSMAAGNPNIIFTGNQTGGVLAELFANAYLFVQPSESEGLSIALLEAMAYGRAVLASDIPENREALENAGLFFQSGRTDDLREKLAETLKDDQLAASKEKEIRAKAAERLSWDDAVKKTLSLYEELKEKA